MELPVYVSSPQIPSLVKRPATRHICSTLFFIGQVVQHRLYNYRGVIVDVDPFFQQSEQWYDEVAQSRPQKDQPWYHILVDQTEKETYVAEENLLADHWKEPIEHSLVQHFFDTFSDGIYFCRSITH
ncbi:heat shock protein HspQ [Magnetococcales bacterium HHB-1]